MNLIKYIIIIGLLLSFVYLIIDNERQRGLISSLQLLQQKKEQSEQNLTELNKSYSKTITDLTEKLNKLNSPKTNDPVDFDNKVDIYNRSIREMNL